MRLLLVALLCTYAVQASIRIRSERHAAPEDMNSEMEGDNKYHAWLSADQKAELKALEGNLVDFKKKTIEFYDKLDDASKDKWNKIYKEQCTSWVKTVTNDAEYSEYKGLESSNAVEAANKREEYKTRLSADAKAKVDAWKDECDRLLTSRSRREIGAEFADFTAWMTEEQKKTLNDMKESGKDSSDIRSKAKEYFNALGGEEKTATQEKLKGKCKAYFSTISTEAEIAEIKDLYESGNADKVEDKVSAIVGRQTGDTKPIAEKMSQICADVFEKPKKRRDVDNKIEKHLSWLTEAQKKEVRDMYSSGKTKEEIRNKIYSFISELAPEARKAAKEQSVKECYAWLKEAASEEEIAALHKMHETDHDGCKTKVREYLARLPADRQASIEKTLPFCEKVWYGDHAAHHDHAHHHKRKRHIHAIEKHLEWLTTEQKEHIETLEKDGVDFDKILEKVKAFFADHSDEKKDEIKLKFKEDCGAWVKRVASGEELEELKNLKEAGNLKEIDIKLTAMEARLTDEERHTVEHTKEVCVALWTAKASRKRRDHHHTLEEGFGKWLTWTTEEQKTELKGIEASGGDTEAVTKKIMEFYALTSGDTHTKAKEELKSACKHYAKEIFGEEKTSEIKALKDSGATTEAISKKLETFVEELGDEKKKEKAMKLIVGCKKLFDESRKRRDHHHTLEEGFGKWLTWTTEEQKSELKELEAEGKKNEIYKKIMEFYGATSGETKAQATEELKGACKHYAKDVFGEAKTSEIKALKDAGGSDEAIEKKVAELIADISDDVNKAKAQKLADGCRKVWTAASRKRRDHHHTLEEGLNKWLTWTTEEQKTELKSLEADGKKEELYKRSMEFYAATSGETKTKATEELKGACKHYATDLFGEEKTSQIKDLKESGASDEAIETKIKEFVGEIEDETKKAKALKLVAGCGKIYAAAASRKRRDHHHTLEEGLNKWLTWTTEEQKTELKSLEADGKKEELYKKIMEFYAATSGETKTKATEELNGACKHYATDLFGEEKTSQIKDLKESGASDETIETKIKEFVGEMEDETKKAKALKLVAGCGKIYAAAASRKRRDHHHTLEKGLNKWLSWTTEKQKTELKSLEADGKKEELYKRIMEFYAATSGETKTKATEELKCACNHYATDLFGEEKISQIKDLKESGTSDEAIGTKFMEFVEEMEDETKKAKALKLVAGCGKIYAAAASRKRRDHHHTVEEGLNKWLTWTTEEQKTELKSLEADGKKDELYKKIMEFYAATSGETKTKATEELKGACKHYATDLFGEEKTSQIKDLKESGASDEAIETKIKEFVGEIEDETKKAKALKLVAGCGKIYAAAASRKRRDHHHTLEEGLNKWLTWTTEEQKTELKGLEADGKKEELYKKIMEFYAATSGETKTQATEELKGACKHYATDLFGEEKTSQIKDLKESGASDEAIETKIKEFVGEIEDETKKAKALKLVDGCGKIYASSKTKRSSRSHKISSEELKDVNDWFNDYDKIATKEMLEAGNRKQAHKKLEGLVGKQLTKKLGKFCMNMVPGESYDEELMEICQLLIDSKMTRSRRYSGEVENY